jgi:Arc/MetJ family transcription regulator
VGRGEYLRAGAWLGDLRRLHEAGWSDAAVAAALSECLGRRVSRRAVWYWRRQLIELDDLLTAADRRRLYQSRCGFGHLLPREQRWSGPRQGRGQSAAPGVRWSGGRELSPREVDVLSCLREHGPLTPAALAGRLYVVSLRPTLRRLDRLGLVRRQPRGPLYALADAALPDPGPRPPTGVERRCEGRLAPQRVAPTAS